MNFSLEHLKHHKIKVNWKTIYVGIRLDLISYKEISKYDVEYLSNHTDCENSLILELAWGAGDPDEDYRKLQMVLVELYNDLVEEESSQWDVEKRKWRYGITSHLKEKIRIYLKSCWMSFLKYTQILAILRIWNRLFIICLLQMAIIRYCIQKKRI